MATEPETPSEGSEGCGAASVCPVGSGWAPSTCPQGEALWAGGWNAGAVGVSAQADVAPALHTNPCQTLWRGRRTPQRLSLSRGSHHAQPRRSQWSPW